MKHYHRVHGVHAVTIGETGHIHDTVEPTVLGDERLVIDCPLCEPYLHPMDWSSKPSDVSLTFDEEQRRVEAETREKRLAPELAELVAAVVNQQMTVRQPSTPPLMTVTDPEEVAILEEIRRRRAEPAQPAMESV